MKLLKRKTSLMLRLGISAMALLIGQHAMALGTDPGIIVTNTANVDYEVLGFAQATAFSNACLVRMLLGLTSYFMRLYSIPPAVRAASSFL